MTHSRSARKRARSSFEDRRRNRSVRSEVRTRIAKAARLVVAGDPALANDAVNQALSTVDRSVRKGVIHRNNAARRKSRLMKRFNAASASNPPTRA